MLNLLKDKEVIFFDVGYTLDAPASGDWMAALYSPSSWFGSPLPRTAI